MLDESMFDRDVIAEGFDKLFALQLSLEQVAYQQDPRLLLGDDLADFIRWNAYALEDELHEATAEVGWKPWATSRHINREAFAGEIVDLLHFLANLCLATGVTGEMLAEGYLKKRQRNLKRQQEGYDGVSGKCRWCGRDLQESRCTHKYCYEWGEAKT